MFKAIEPFLHECAQHLLERGALQGRPCFEPREQGIGKLKRGAHDRKTGQAHLVIRILAASSRAFRQGVRRGPSRFR
jgi:hypothetical protein